MRLKWDIKNEVEDEHWYDLGDKMNEIKDGVK